jgi:hypothetical protein
VNEVIAQVWIINSADGRWLAGPFDTEQEALGWLAEFHKIEKERSGKVAQ